MAKITKEKFEEVCYYAYQLDWMIAHGYSLLDLFGAIIGNAEEDITETPMKDPGSAESLSALIRCAIERFFDEDGFEGGHIFASLGEFLDAEYRDGGYMKRLLGMMPEPKKMLSLWKKYAGGLDISHVLTISTAHIREKTAQMLNDAGEYGLPVSVYKKDGFGWWVYIPEYWDSWNSREAVPDDLAACIDFAFANGCEWLCLDRDAEEVSLPQYE